MGEVTFAGFTGLRQALKTGAPFFDPNGDPDRLSATLAVAKGNSCLPPGIAVASRGSR